MPDAATGLRYHNDTFKALFTSIQRQSNVEEEQVPLGNSDVGGATGSFVTHVDGNQGNYSLLTNFRVNLKRQIELGITPPGTQLSERMWFLPDPIVLAPASRAILGKKMELYAGMVENLDHHVGRLIDHLKKIGEYENTIFIVFGDNGAEGTDLFKMIAGSPGTRDFLYAAITWSQTHPNAWGDPGSYVGYGPMWAQVSMTPFSSTRAGSPKAASAMRSSSAARSSSGRQAASTTA